jgi:hypothetical protein
MVSGSAATATSANALPPSRLAISAKVRFSPSDTCSQPLILARRIPFCGEAEFYPGETCESETAPDCESRTSRFFSAFQFFDHSGFSFKFYEFRLGRRNECMNTDISCEAQKNAASRSPLVPTNLSAKTK